MLGVPIAALYLGYRLGDMSNKPKYNKKYHMQGRRAFINGEPSSDNPYPSNGSSQLRVDWFNGWYDEWRWQKWGPVAGEDIYDLSGAPDVYPVSGDA